MVASNSAAQGSESRIFFIDRDGDWDIYSMNANGDDVVQLTDHPASDRFPAGSPGGEGLRSLQSAALRLPCM